MTSFYQPQEYILSIAFIVHIALCAADNLDNYAALTEDKLTEDIHRQVYCIHGVCYFTLFKNYCQRKIYRHTFNNTVYIAVLKLNLYFDM